MKGLLSPNSLTKQKKKKRGGGGWGEMVRFFPQSRYFVARPWFGDLDPAAMSSPSDSSGRPRETRGWRRRKSLHGAGDDAVLKTRLGARREALRGAEVWRQRSGLRGRRCHLGTPGLSSPCLPAAAASRRHLARPEDDETTVAPGLRRCGAGVGSHPLPRRGRAALWLVSAA